MAKTCRRERSAAKSWCRSSRPYSRLSNDQGLEFHQRQVSRRKAVWNRPPCGCSMLRPQYSFLRSDRRFLIWKGTLFDLDLKINACTIKVANPGLSAFLGAISDLGSIYLVVMVAVIVGVILFIRKSWWRLLALFLAVGIGQAVLNILKVVFQRPRPKTEMFVFSYSFPSRSRLFRYRALWFLHLLDLPLHQ